MAPLSPRVVVKVDLKKKPWQQNQPLHNRWHPEIPPVAEVKAGEFFRVEMIDCMGGVVKDNDSASDIKNADLTNTHYLSGPIKVVDEDGVAAKPGDLLAVEICNLGPLPGDEWGFTGSFDRENGGGFLTDHFPCATKAIWYFEGIYAYSPQIPGVRFPGLTHPGVIGTAPSMELLRIWNERERQLEESGLKSPTLCEVVHQRPLANLPTTKGCLLGNIEGTPEWERIANEAARTIPGRENGGNCDIKNLSRGSKIYLPVFVEGANLSTGDMHFSQGDGEISFCGAIEMSGFLELKCEIIRNGMQEYLTPMGPTPLHVNPIFEIGPVEPRFSEWLVFEGISVDESGRQHYLDATVAYKRAVLNAIDYLFKFGYSKEQVYLLLSCCPCEGRLSGIVDSPNAVATLAIPTAIFDQDIRPKTRKVPVGPRIVRKPDVLKSTYDGKLPITKNPSSSTSY
ncbi:Acetamidase/Formamidase [Arabidopsis suecica]|uniref:Acetamidase/Formamidase n=1 Tax=Arabidopsis suecica TaxID=45249 RepID=A0A8T1YF24_ARASU|nr:Acetamidase/Formamidase [Arabidopsis suecica]